MNPNLSSQAIKAIESLCESGCTTVTRTIEDARNGKPVEQLREFSDAERKMIIDELGEIMSVYDNPDC